MNYSTNKVVSNIPSKKAQHTSTGEALAIPVHVTTPRCKCGSHVVSLEGVDPEGVATMRVESRLNHGARIRTLGAGLPDMMREHSERFFTVDITRRKHSRVITAIAPWLPFNVANYARIFGDVISELRARDARLSLDSAASLVRWLDICLATGSRARDVRDLKRECDRYMLGLGQRVVTMEIFRAALRALHFVPCDAEGNFYRVCVSKVW